MTREEAQAIFKATPMTNGGIATPFQMELVSIINGGCAHQRLHNHFTVVAGVAVDGMMSRVATVSVYCLDCGTPMRPTGPLLDAERASLRFQMAPAPDLDLADRGTPPGVA